MKLLGVFSDTTVLKNYAHQFKLGNFKNSRTPQIDLAKVHVNIYIETYRNQSFPRKSLVIA